LASVRYYIEKRRDPQGRLITRNVPILLYFSFDGKRLQLSTGERVDAGDWDAENQEVRQEAPGSRQLNRYLRSLGEELMDIYREARSTGIQPGTTYLREQLKYRRRKDNIDFFDVLMHFIDENHSRWSIYTFRKIRTLYNHLRRFSETEQVKIQFNRIDRDFLDHYVRFFKIKYDHTNNTIAKNISVLKWFLNWACERGYNKSTLYRDYKLAWVAKPRVRAGDQVLDWEELMRLSRYEPSSGNLREVRDIFCFMCFTGLKLSRVNHLMRSDVFSDHIRVPGRTESGYYNLPLNERALGILEKYLEGDHPGGTCFPSYPNPYFNRLLKQLGKDAGINRFVPLEIHSGTDKGIRQVPKYEILTSKVAVNTFILNGLRLGVSAEVLSYVTGQKTLAGVERIRPLLEQAAFDDIRKFNEMPY
jgi:integrase